jgi:hypothetical protein
MGPRLASEFGGVDDPETQKILLASRFRPKENLTWHFLGSLPRPIDLKILGSRIPGTVLGLSPLLKNVGWNQME